LQLGVITGKKRRRRESDAPDLSAQEAEAVQQKLNEIALLERFIAQVNTLKIRKLFSTNKIFKKTSVTYALLHTSNSTQSMA
jgi:hypothetical protein